MLWKGRSESGNVDDRRGKGGKAAIGGFGIVVVIILSLVFKQNPADLLNKIGGSQTDEPLEQTAEDKELASFSSVVLKDTEDVWDEIFKNSGSTYQKPTLVLFTNSVESGCGSATSSVGPFYCSADEKLYIDLSFFKDLKERFQAPGDFAMAYVIAHEVGHHIQHLMGTTDKVHSQKGQLSEEEYNKLSVKLELQADFLAGVWAHHAQDMKQILESGDIEEALGAANAIGDDRLQKQAGREIDSDLFTHGTSAQRMFWFKKGYTTGDIKQGDTFNTDI